MSGDYYLEKKNCLWPWSVRSGCQSDRIFWIHYKIWWRKVWCYLLI